MPFFTPESTIIFANTGLDDNNKTVHTSNQEVGAWVLAHILGEQITSASFQRLDQGWEIRVPTDAIAYDLLMKADTVAINNSITYGGLWTVGIIDRVDWKNPGCAYVYFHIDWYTTTLGTVQYENTWAYIEREHVEKDWNGSNPEFSNMGVDEGFGTTPDTPVKTYNHNFTFNRQRVMVFTPYDDEGKPNFAGTMENGLYTAMFQREMTVDECNKYLQKIAESDTADLANIPSIVSIPDTFVNGEANQRLVYPMPWLDHTPNVPEIRNSKCWSGELCQIKLVSGTGGSISMNPQWFGSNTAQLQINLDTYFNNGDGGCVATFFNKNGTYDMPTYGDFAVSLVGLPQSVWVGDAYAQWKAANTNGYMLQCIGGAISNVWDFVKAYGSGNPIAQDDAIVHLTTTAITSAGDIARTIGNAKTSGTVLGGNNNTDVNTSVALGKYGFQIIYYMCQPYIIKAADAYFDRFGYKVNALKKLNRRARPKWTYIKCHEVHLNAGGNINRNARNYIQNMLVRGVTFWRDPDNIGDYSDPESNKGV